MKKSRRRFFRAFRDLAIALGIGRLDAAGSSGPLPAPPDEYIFKNTAARGPSMGSFEYTAPPWAEDGKVIFSDLADFEAAVDDETIEGDGIRGRIRGAQIFPED